MIHVPKMISFIKIFQIKVVVVMYKNEKNKKHKENIEVPTAYFSGK